MRHTFSSVDRPHAQLHYMYLWIMEIRLELSESIESLEAHLSHNMPSGLSLRVQSLCLACLTYLAGLRSKKKGFRSNLYHPRTELRPQYKSWFVEVFHRLFS